MLYNKTNLLLSLFLVGMLFSAQAQAPRGAFFTFTPLGEEIFFHNQSYPESEIASYEWDFGDGGMSTDKDPKHFYASPGTYLVTLTVHFSSGQPAFLPYPYQITIPEFGGTHHDYTSAQVNGSPIIVDLFDEYGIDPAHHTLTILTASGAPFLGTATINMDEAIEYTPGATTGWDVIEYRVAEDSSMLADTGYVYVEVFDGNCAYDMHIYTEAKHCAERCTNPPSTTQWWWTQPSPNNPGACYAYKFVFRNTSTGPMDQMTATVQLPSSMSLNNDMGSQVLGDHNTTTAQVNVNYDADMHQISFNLASGQMIGAHEVYEFLFRVDVDALPADGSGGLYHTSMTGSAHCAAGAGPVVEDNADVHEGSVCDPNEIEGFPVGCGQFGDIGPNVHQMRYTIRFDNTGGGPVTNATVRPDGRLDLWIPASVRVLTGHPFPPTKSINPATGELNFTWTNMNLPPISQDSIGGIGEVVFTVDLDTANATNGQWIDVWADVFFDAALPQRTDTVFNTYRPTHPIPFFDLGQDISFTGADTTVVLKPTIIGGDENAYKYLWTGGSTADSVSFTSTGPVTTMELIVTDTTRGCSEHDQISLLNPEAVGIDKYLDIFSLQVYPNPFRDITYFEFEGHESIDQVRLEIFNSLGQKVHQVYQGQIMPGQQMKLEFDGSNLPAGVYFYQLTNSEGNKTSGRLVHTN